MGGEEGRALSITKVSKSFHNRAQLGYFLPSVDASQNGGLGAAWVETMHHRSEPILLISNSAYLTAHLLPACGPFAWSPDLSNSFCDLIPLKPLLDTMLGGGSAQETRHEALHPFCLQLCLFLL